MFFLSLKVTIRSFFKQKTSFFFSLGSLVLGFSCLALISMYLIDENKFDTFHKDAHRIYRVTHHINYGDSEENSASCPFPVGKILAENYQDKIQSVARLFNWWGEIYTVKYEDIKYNEKGFVFADSSLFTVFPFDFLLGNPKDALNAPNKIVITQSIAEKYFGNPENALGKSLRINDQFFGEITGIIKDLPSYSHFHFNMFCSLSTFITQNNNNIDWWWCNPAWTYVKLQDKTQAKELTNILNSILQTNVPDYQQKTTDFDFQALTDIHLNSKLDGEIEENANKANNYILIGLALIVILIAFVNYINIAIINHVSRSKEHAVRKILGSDNKSIFYQSILETYLLLFFSLAISAIVILITLPYFNHISGKSLAIIQIFNKQYLSWVVLITALIGIVIAYLPSIYTSAISPLSIFKTQGKSNQFSSNVKIQSPLLIFQFTLSIVLTIGCIAIIRQLNFMQNADLGFDKQNLMVLYIKNTPLKNKFYEFKEDLSHNPKIKDIAFFECLPGKEFYKENFYPEGRPEGDQKQLYYFSRVEKDYVKTLGLQIIEGRDFSEEFSAEPENAILINETMVRHLGWTNKSAIGKKFNFHNQEKVVGVIKDFNYHSLHKEIEPFVIDLVRPNTGQHDWATNYIGIKLTPGAGRTTIGEIEKCWNQFAGNFPFNYFFLDQNMKKVYLTETKLVQVSIVFSCIALLLTCIGLYSLVLSITQKKIKEIGIRKVNGAKISEVIVLLNHGFVKWFLIAFVFAIPITYLTMNRWLENFAYKTNLSWWIFGLAGILAFGVALLTVSWQCWRAATRNPVEALRYE